MSIKRSNRPFRGAYNRCYIDKNGKHKKMYTNDSSFGTSNRIPSIHIPFLVFLSIFIIIVVSTLFESIVNGQAGAAEGRLVAAALIIISFFLSIIIPDIKANKEAYNYFKEHPDKLNNNKMIVKDICPGCGTQNDNNYINCTNCGKDLKF